MAQLFISLFTTGGKINPIALALFAGTLFLAYQYASLRSEHYELVRQSKVLQKSSDDSVKTLNEARNDQVNAINAINSGTFDNDYLERLQLDD